MLRRLLDLWWRLIEAVRRIAFTPDSPMLTLVARVLKGGSLAAAAPCVVSPWVMFIRWVRAEWQ